MNTPFEEILNTNTVPSDVDCQRIRELLTGPQIEAAKITDEIRRLQSLICELAKKRDALNHFIDPLVALISPARRLPDDVVVEIFTASLPSDRNAVIVGAKSPLLLCHICRAWRNLAISTPRLWTSLHIVAPETPAQVEQLNGIVDSWLSRTGVLPLSISVVQSFRAEFDTDFSTLVQTLIRYSSRWNGIRFGFHRDLSFNPLAALSALDVPILETVLIDHFSGPATGLPFLATSSLRSASFRRGTPRLPLPWNQLHCLFLGEAAACETTAAGLDLLRGCPSLEACALAFVESIPPAAGNVPSPVTCRMEHLRQLSVLDNEIPGGTVEFFKHLDVPNLEFLEYVTGLVEEFPFTPLLTHPLQRLNLNVKYLSSETLIGCLRLLPTLHELFILHDPFSFRGIPARPDNTFWAAMNPEAHTPHNVLCPQLRSVEFTNFTGLSDDMALEFIRARTESQFAGVARLEKFHADFNRPKLLDVTTALQQAVADGLDLSLHYIDDRVKYSPAQDNDIRLPHGELRFDGWRRAW
ncbi:hypothetical protein C8F04DRAFT_1127358 [Mycena alexandri]|uniref:F-box domain-containing protein n=1 Tax=Mycena alexandri TaxID=1745969 RepID=A0AAD6SD54_9AGAR|nr:hypothetical protein C8F04DRAFT_1127358 [Mycena alexandri]